MLCNLLILLSFPLALVPQALEGVAEKVVREAPFTVEEHRLEIKTGPLPEPPSGEILAKRKKWRESSQVGDGIEEFNRKVGPFGYHLEKGTGEDGISLETYALMHGQLPVLRELWNIGHLSLSKNCQHFIFSARINTKQGDRIIFVRDGVAEESRRYGSYYSEVLDGPAPFFLGDALVWCDIQLQDRIEVGPFYYKVFVRTKERILYDDRFYQMAPHFPVKFRPLGESWILEISDWNKPGRVIIDGQDINNRTGYWGIWDYRLISGVPFFFGKRYEGDDFRTIYGGAEIASAWYDFIGYDGVGGVEGNDHMIWFQAKRDNAWYYVEAGRFPSARMFWSLCRPGHLEELRYVIENENVDPDDRDPIGTTALMFAACYGNVEAVRYLIRKGANVNLGSAFGNTALMEAAEMGRSYITRRLLAAGAEIDRQTQKGWTALMWAAEKGYDPVILLLLKAGANVSLKNKKGETAAQIAQKNNHLSTMRLLR